MVNEITTQGEFDAALGQQGKLVVIDFSADWCGPCRNVAPAYDALSRKYPPSTCLFYKIMENVAQEVVVAQAVRAFPTFRFYINGRQVDEVQGADIAKVEAKVVQHSGGITPVFAGEGASLGGGGTAVSAEDARAARLARFGGNMPAASSGPRPVNPNAALHAKILAADRGEDGADSGVSVAPMDVDKPPPAPASETAPASSGLSSLKPRRRVDPALLEQLMNDMGFAEERARKALIYAPEGTLEGAVNWLFEHQEDAGIDDPLPEAERDGLDSMQVEDADAAANAAADAQSLKCDDCGATLRDMVAAELHAHKTGHSNFSESTESIKPLTPEEKAAKIQAIKEKIAIRRAAREESEKVETVDREKSRRFMGKEMAKTKEEMEKLARQREIDLRKKEKLDAERERQRLREEIAKDKAERKARGGKLAGKLSIEGYQPVGLQQERDGGASAAAPEASAAAAGTPAPPAAVDSMETVKKAITLLSQQRIGGEGGTAMKTVLLYLNNVIAHPEDVKYRSMNMENKGFKTRVAGCLGGVPLLKALGFAKVDPGEEGGDARLVLSEEATDLELLTSAKNLLERAIAAYGG